MKYDRNTMKSLQEAYESVSDRDPNTGLPKGLKAEKVKKVKTKKAKKPNYEGSTAGSDVNDLKDSYFPEEQEHEGMKYSDKKKLERQEQLKKASKKAPVVKNKIVPTKKRIEEAIKMTQQEYAKTHKDFKSDDPKNPRVTKYVPGKGTVSTPVEIVKKKEDIDEGNKENCGCGETPCKTYGQKKAMDDKMKEVEDMRSLPTRMNLIKTKLRAMGLNMSHELKGKELSEVINYAVSHYISEEEYDHYKDRMAERGIDISSKDKKDATTLPQPKRKKVKGDTPMQKEFKKKYGKNATALDAVKQDIEKKHGKGAIKD